MSALVLLQAASPAEEVSNLTGPVVDYVRFFLVLGGILVLAYVTLRFWLPRLAGVPRPGAGPIQVVARYAIEPRKSLYIVKTAGEYLLIGVTEQGINLLKSLDAAAVEANVAVTGGAPSRDFASFLKSWSKRRDNGS